MASPKVLFQLYVICFFFYYICRHAMCFDRQLPDISALESCNIDRIYNLGDSTSDVGNRVVEDPVNPCLQPPYGMNFYQGPTGRCSDGMLIIDYTFCSAGLPLMDPYLQGNSNFTHGVNFAVGGATALSFACNTSNAIHFKDCSPGCLKNALLMLGLIGSNDYNFALSMGQTIEDAQKLVPDVIEVIKDAVRRIISLGGAQIVIPGSFPMGCFPTTQVTFKTDIESAYDERHCLKDINDLLAIHNEYLQQAIITLQEENPTTTILYADYYNAYIWLLDNASQLGFDATTVLEGCCGNGGMSGSVFPTDVCGSPIPSCPDPDRYINWDGIHMAGKAHYFLTNWLVADMIPKLNCSLQVADHYSLGYGVAF
ncbi:acetylajmalan esterase-like [Apium graveolens]|uniref:acetylajmalan esterase-like n=1 Tax=Apium graveolens TaxID=4045 RepID=UPI003D7B92A4